MLKYHYVSTPIWISFKSPLAYSNILSSLEAIRKGGFNEAEFIHLYNLEVSLEL